MALSYILPVAKRLVLGGFSGVISGALIIETPDREPITLGTVSPDTQAPKIQVRNEFFWLRVVLFGDLGFSESYLLDEISTTDLTAVFEFFIHNNAAVSTPTTLGLFSSLFSNIFRRTINNVSASRLNAAAHYSISNDMFAAFLSPDMTYSAPIWLPLSNPLSKTETLEEAQLRKLQYAISQTRIRESDHVLEIGTGWGSFAIAAARMTGCRVTTVTPSSEQKRLAEEHIKRSGLSDKIEVVQADYRELGGLGTFDKMVSIEMIEHVGHEFLNTYFECVDRYLKRDGGIGYFQCITIPETRYERYRRSEDFIKKYIFPGGHLPTVSGLVASIDRGSRGRLIVEEIKSVGKHYSKALKCWNEKFQENFEAKIVPALREGHPGMTTAEMEVFRKKWEYYFCYCEAGFNTKALGDVAITVGRENCVALLEEV
ncbi:Tuberculostearic acid methyltransferase UfaA1 [Cytospora mali]|uniref:Tuberculostearic acid methyltransferase UfaA1 n=1 Tax=Cytospora mali TaxID=578113 RepID=A0A194VJ72_CYTMA|nr:Tuberculostearic acid methyltransferase UfaA1 [Valsa mali]KUI64197.1 Tuberculostearic acid methyltransferase UfaA1 [Valsa mali]